MDPMGPMGLHKNRLMDDSQWAEQLLKQEVPLQSPLYPQTECD